MICPRIHKWVSKNNHSRVQFQQSSFDLRPKMCRPSANTEKFPPRARKTSGTQGTFYYY